LPCAVPPYGTAPWRPSAAGLAGCAPVPRQHGVGVVRGRAPRRRGSRWLLGRTRRRRRLEAPLMTCRAARRRCGQGAAARCTARELSSSRLHLGALSAAGVVCRAAAAAWAGERAGPRTRTRTPGRLGAAGGDARHATGAKCNALVRHPWKLRARGRYAEPSRMHEHAGLLSKEVP